LVQLVFAGNYEANTNYFPLSWKPELNPFAHLKEGNGIEAQ
jgi:hypothetical protein